MPAQVGAQVRGLPVNFPTAGDVADVLLLLPRAGPSEKDRCGESGS